MKALDLVNQRFGRLVAIRKSHRQNNKVMWECLCDCGNTTYVSTNYLTSGRIRSCGCFRKDQISERNTTHNQRHTRLYEVWKNIKCRCYNPNNKAYKNYGGRGIAMFDEWHNNYQAFYDWSISNGYSLGLTIDRIDVNGNYEPTNCRWVNRTVQANNKRANHYITYNGETHSIADWARKQGLSYECLSARLNSCWGVEKALTTPNTHLLYKPRKQK